VADHTNRAEREQLAHALRVIARDALDGNPGIPGRGPGHWAAGNATVTDLIYDVTSRLHARHPVHARGIARLRMLLSDGNGPLYRPRRDSLPAALQGVLAAL
jgi:hypothetical protein